jgi:hypothetical protein
MVSAFPSVSLFLSTLSVCVLVVLGVCSQECKAEVVETHRSQKTKQVWEMSCLKNRLLSFKKLSVSLIWMEMVCFLIFNIFLSLIEPALHFSRSAEASSCSSSCLFFFFKKKEKIPSSLLVTLLLEPFR